MVMVSDINVTPAEVIMISDDKQAEYHRAKYGRYYAPGFLDPDKHRLLVENLQHYAVTAGVPPYYVYKLGMVGLCSDPEIEWVRGFRKHQASGDTAGLAYVGNPARLGDRIMAMTGVFLRNFVDARVIGVHALLDAIKKDDAPTNTLVLVPDFYDGRERTLAEWQPPLLSGWLLSRYSSGKLTVLGLDNTGSRFKQKFGDLIHDHVVTSFHQITE